MDSADLLDDAARALPAAPEALAVLAASVRGCTTDDPNAGGEQRISSLATQARADVAERRQALAAAAGSIGEATLGREAHRRATADLQVADAVESQARTAASQAAANLQECTTDWLARVTGWRQGLRVLDNAQISAPTPESEPDLEVFGDTVNRAHRRAVERLSAAKTVADNQAKDLKGRADDLAVQIELCRTVAPEPGGPEWRPDRSNRAGGPLWALIDFATGLNSELAARIEGALLAVGLLDAWVSPDGQLTAGDIHLIPTACSSARTLANYLVVDDSTTVSPKTVQMILNSIAVVDNRAELLAHGDGDTVVCLDGTARVGALQAATPADGKCLYIGLTARERAREERLAALTEEHRQLVVALIAAQSESEQAQQDLDDAETEAGYPSPVHVRRLRQALADAASAVPPAVQRVADTREQEANTRAAAEQAEQRAEQICRDAGVAANPTAVTAAQDACAALPGPIEKSEGAGCAAISARRTAAARTAQAEQLDDTADQAQIAAQQAQDAVDEARAEANGLPPADLVQAAREEAAERTNAAGKAADEADRVQRDLDRAEDEVRLAQTTLHNTAKTETGRTLPTDAEHLGRQQTEIEQLLETAGGWTRAADRAATLIANDARLRTVADKAGAAATRHERSADRAEELARVKRRRFEEESRTHGADFQTLLSELAEARTRQTAVRGQHAAEQQNVHDADIALARNEADAENRRDAHGQACLRRESAAVDFIGLFEHGLIEDVVDTEGLDRPAGPDDAVAAARTLSGTRKQHGTAHVTSTEASVNRTLSALDTLIRNSVLALARLGRQIETVEVAGTGWRRVVISEGGETGFNEAVSDSLHAKPLRQALADLARSIEVLDRDYSDQVRAEVKGSLLTDLRKHVNVRIALAGKIVEDIQAHLDGIRTGVAAVGVALDWRVRDDPAAKRAVSLIREAAMEDASDDLYEFFIARLMTDGADGGTWAERVQKAFDYREWFDWDVSITHADFTEPGGGELFRKVTPRNNPLDKLSTGEKRLATMLPLLAAARALYSRADYTGPHTVFVDELDAAFDPRNLRKIIGLMREWDFDVITTLPTMNPLLKSETGSVAIHRIEAARGGTRVSIPCLWTGNGQPTAARIAVGVTAPHSRQTDSVQDMLQFDTADTDGA